LKRGALFTAIAVLVIAIGVTLTQKQNVDVQHQREAALRDTLASTRHAIGAYRAKHQHNPASLNDLVTGGELRAIPTDPITHSNTTWKTTTEESVSVDDFQAGSTKPAPSIVDVHSGAPGSDSAGRPFADY
jgi:general secretion pathway protein G